MLVHFLRFVFLVALVALSPTSWAQEPAAESTATTDEALSFDDELRGFLATYVQAFNSGDAKQLAPLWAEDAVWTDAETAATETGRGAIVAALEASVKDHPGLRVSGQIDRVQKVTDNVASIEGTVITTCPEHGVFDSQFTAVIVKTAAGWQFANVREFAPPVVTSAYEKLRELEYLIGEWDDETNPGDAEGRLLENQVKVHTTVRWGANRSFLVRTYSVEYPGEDPLQGTQVIGWDPRAQTIRSWSFNSQGGFGEGTWTHAGDELVGRMSETLPDGGAASGTQIIKLVDRDTIEVSTVGREIDGEPAPSTPVVRVKRVNETALTDANATASPGLAP